MRICLENFTLITLIWRTKPLNPSSKVHRVIIYFLFSKKGIGAGIFSVYACSSYFTYFKRFFPSLKYWAGAKFLAQAGTIYAFYKLGDYYFTSRRYGSNDPRMNGLMYSNRYYSENKESLM